MLLFEGVAFKYFELRDYFVDRGYFVISSVWFLLLKGEYVDGINYRDVSVYCVLLNWLVILSAYVD